MKKIFLFLLLTVFLQDIVKSQDATFVVTSVNTTTEMDQAIDFALGLWGQKLRSNIPIKIHVVYASQINLFLGVSLANAEKNFPNAPFSDVWYPTSLANAIANEELNPGETDMEILIGQADWYFGTDGNPGTGQQDFISVFLHEVCHSLGFVSLSKKETNGIGSFGNVKPSDLGLVVSSFTFKDLEGLPGVFDSYLVDGNSQLLTDPMFYANNSAELGARLTSNSVFFSGDSATAAHGDLFPKIYVPSSFQLGSSCSHVDETTYNNTVNSMMTPFSAAGDVEHEPGPIVTGVLYDIGWNQYDHPAVATTDLEWIENNLTVFPIPFTQNTTWDFTLPQASEVQLKVYNELGQQVYQSPKTKYFPGTHQIQWDASAHNPGLYHYQLSFGENQSSASILKME